MNKLARYCDFWTLIDIYLLLRVLNECVQHGMGDNLTPKQRRAALAREAEMKQAQANGRPANGVPRAPAQEEEEDEQTDENIFLFVPNLIGRYSSCYTRKAQ